MPSKFTFQVTKQHPYQPPDSLGNKRAQEFYALVQAMASNPSYMFQMKPTDKWYYFCPSDKNKYLIEVIVNNI